jgi:hypothetical protein
MGPAPAARLKRRGRFRRCARQEFELSWFVPVFAFCSDVALAINPFCPWVFSAAIAKITNTTDNNCVNTLRSGDLQRIGVCQ